MKQVEPQKMSDQGMSSDEKVKTKINRDKRIVKPSKVQEHIYNQIGRGLTDVLSEFELLGDIKQGGSYPGTFDLESLGGLLPTSVL